MSEEDYDYDLLNSAQRMFGDLNRMQQAIQRVRELHFQDEPNWCFHCDDLYPCPTIKALDGEQ